MPDFINLTCPSCGAKLQITNDIERFSCGHCGNEHIVKRGEGIVSLVPVLNEVKGVRKAADHTASELAIVRIQKEIEYLNNQLINRNTRADYLIIVIAIILLSLSVVLAKTISQDLCYGAAIGFALAIIGKILVILKKEKGRGELQAQLNAKLIELRKHQNIVSNG